MCLNYTFSCEFKNKVISSIDSFNGGLIDLLDNFDDKCTEMGNFFIRKYKFYFEKNRYTKEYSNYKYNRTPLSPDDYEQINIPHSTQPELNMNIKQNTRPNQIVSNQIVSNQIVSNQTNAIELVDKHIVDNRDSFLDDAWDILNDTY
jgi:hypothetical protein